MASATGSVLRVGLTGGIASGKSLVSNELAARGALVIDADRLAREVLEPGSAGLEEVVTAFGPEVLDSNGALDRPALARIVFADPSARERLNAIVHPLVRGRAAEQAESADPGTIIVEDIPLLVETGQAGRFDVVVVVQSAEREQLRRMTQERGMSPEEARSRIEAQADDAQRAAVADVVLHNDGAPEELVAKVQELYEQLQEELAGR